MRARVVHLWWARADAATCRRWVADLDDAERARAGAMATAEGRREQVVARALTRRTLSRYAPVAPAEWRFVAGPWGKPAVDAAAGLPLLAFNVSHGGGVVACAVAAGGRVGCDVEALDARRATRELAAAAFTAAELAGLRDLDAEDHCRRFFRLWTLKEAYLKARGFGLRVPLTDVEVRLGDPPVLSHGGPADLPYRAWHLTEHQLADGHVAALAADSPVGAPVRVEVFGPTGVTRTSQGIAGPIGRR